MLRLQEVFQEALPLEMRMQKILQASGRALVPLLVVVTSLILVLLKVFAFPPT